MGENGSINLLESNYRLQISIEFNGKVMNCSQSFYSELKFNKILHSLMKQIKNKEGLKTKIVLIDNINKNSKTIYGNLKFLESEIIEITDSDDNMIVSKNEIIEKLLVTNINCVILKNSRYRIIIDNCNSVTSDKKSFSISCEDNIDQVKMGILKLLGLIKKNEVDDNLVFAENRDVPSHRILVQKSGSVDNYKEKSLGFSIIFPNYSSSELIELFIKHIKLNGGK